MLDLAELARIEERRLSLGLASVALEHRWLPGGGVVTRGEPGTWINTSAGLGMSLEGRPVPDEDLDALVEWFESVRIEPRTEVCPFAHPSLVRGLAARGFVLRGFENTFFREIEAGRRVEAPNPLGGGIRVDEVAVLDDGLVWEYAAAVARGFVPPDRAPAPEDIALWVRCLRQPAVKAFAAFADGRIVGGGAMEIPRDADEPGAKRAAALFGLSVLPQYRRRGVQQALIAVRLSAAAEAGAVVATVGASPGVATERNARRMGFQLAYTKAILAKPGPGLTPNLS